MAYPSALVTTVINSARSSSATPAIYCYADLGPDDSYGRVCSLSWPTQHNPFWLLPSHNAAEAYAKLLKQGSTKRHNVFVRTTLKRAVDIPAGQPLRYYCHQSDCELYGRICVITVGRQVAERRTTRRGPGQRPRPKDPRYDALHAVICIKSVLLFTRRSEDGRHVGFRRVYLRAAPDDRAPDSTGQSTYHTRLSGGARSSSSMHSSPAASVAGSSASQPSSFKSGPSRSTGSPAPTTGHSRLSVSSLLCEDPEPSGLSYRLEVVQQPERAAEFTHRPLSRLPVAPPPIVQLHIRDQAGNPVNEDMELPFLVAHLTLLSEDGKTAVDSVPPPDGEGPSLRLLNGTLVSSPHYLRNLQGKRGIYFLFPDVSIRWRGRYCLAVLLVRLSSDPLVGVGRQGTVVTEVRTNAFDVLPYSSYAAPPQTQLSQYFLQQGARLYTFSSSVSNPSPQSPQS